MKKINLPISQQFLFTIPIYHNSDNNSTIHIKQSHCQATCLYPKSSPYHNGTAFIIHSHPCFKQISQTQKPICNIHKILQNYNISQYLDNPQYTHNPQQPNPCQIL